MSQNKLTVALILSMILAITLSLSLHSIPPRKVQAATTNITLYAYISGWTSPTLPGSNPTITVTQGDTISFTVIGGDTLIHRLLVDIDNSSITTDCPNTGPDQCSGVVGQGQTSSIAPFAAPSPGTYYYYCTYHSPYSMVGKFVVVKAPTPDFTVNSNPTSIGPLDPRVNGTSTITVAPTNGFSGTVMLTAYPSSGLNATLNPTSIPAASGVATLTVNSTKAGSYSVMVTGTGSSGTHSVTVTVTVIIPDFKIALSASSLNVALGSSAGVTVTLTSLNGFSGTVSLTSTVSSTGPQVTFNPVSVALASAGSATSTLSVSAMSSGVYSRPVATGNYSANITGTSGSLVHSATLELTVGSSSAAGAGALPAAVIIGGGAVGVLVATGTVVFFLRRRPKTKA